MIRLFMLSLVLLSQAFATDTLQVTAPGTHSFTTTETSYDWEYRRVGIPQPGCVDQCDVFGCNQNGSGGPMCEPAQSMPYPTNSYSTKYKVEMLILPPPEGMNYDETFYLALDPFFKGSQQFAFTKETVKVGSNSLRITLKPVVLKGLLDSVTLDKHVYLEDGVFTYFTNGPATSLGVNTILGLEKEYNVFRPQRSHSFYEKQLASVRISEVTPTGVKHTVDLNQLLDKPLENGKWIMSLRTSLNYQPLLLIDRNFQNKLESSLWYTMKNR